MPAIFLFKSIWFFQFGEFGFVLMVRSGIGRWDGLAVFFRPMISMGESLSFISFVSAYSDHSLFNSTPPRIY